MEHQFVKSILKDLGINFSQQHYTILKLLEDCEHLYLTEFVGILVIYFKMPPVICLNFRWFPSNPPQRLQVVGRGHYR